MPSVNDPTAVLTVGSEGRSVTCPGVGYLVTDSDDILQARSRTYDDGRTSHEIGLFNPSSVRLSLGAEISPNTLIGSCVDTIGATERAREIHSIFAKEIRRHGVKCGSYVIMPGAAAKLEAGWRRAQGVAMASFTDFKLEAYRECLAKLRSKRSRKGKSG